MALKFLNKKGWHTGSLRNIENVWKAEQKHEAEEKKLDELRKQIIEERERSEFRLLQEQAGLVPKQERLDFLYESGLAVGKKSEGFKELAAPAAAPASPAPPPGEPSSSKAAVPGALFEDKPQSANDAWRKLHSDPLLLIRQREKEALDRIKNNPMKMAMIRKSVETDKKHKGDKKEKREKKDQKRKHKSKHDNHASKLSSNPEESSGDEKDTRKREHPTSGRQQHKSKRERHSSDVRSDSEDLSEGYEERKRRDRSKHSNRTHSDPKHTAAEEQRRSVLKNAGAEEQRRKADRHPSDVCPDSEDLSERYEERKRRDRPEHSNRTHSDSKHIGAEEYRRKADQTQGRGYIRQRNVPKLSEEERAARLREMQLDAELHEEQRWKRLKKAADADAQEVIRASSSGGKNFLDAAQKSIYGTEKGGSATIEESVRRRAYYSQGGSAAHETNAFRR